MQDLTSSRGREQDHLGLCDFSLDNEDLDKKLGDPVKCCRISNFELLELVPGTKS